MKCTVLVYIFIWGRNLDYFPSYPGWMAVFAYRIMELIPGAGSQEDLTDIYMLLVASINVSIFVLIDGFVWRFWRKRSD